MIFQPPVAATGVGRPAPRSRGRAGRVTAETRAMLDALSVGVLLTRDDLILTHNPQLGSLLGYPADALGGIPFEILLANPGQAADLLAEVLLAAEAGVGYRSELALRHRSGWLCPVRLSVQAAAATGPRTLVWVVEEVSPDSDARQALQKATREVDAILNTAVMGITVLRHRRIDRCNRRMEELFGFAPGEMTGRSTRVWYPSVEDYAAVGADVYGELGAGREVFREREFQRRDGSRFWGRLAGRALDPANPYAASVWIIEDLTEEHLAREELLLAQKVFEVNSDAIMITDARNRIVSVNPAFEAITGYSGAEVRGQDPRIMGSGRHDAGFFGAMWRALQNEGHWSGEIWDRRKDGTDYPKWLNIDTLRNGAGDITHHVAVFSDITDRKASEERIRYLAHHDPLTALPNRFTLLAHLEHALARARRSGAKVALMFIDLDDFKAINDTLGHHVGDLLLCEVARRISGAVRNSDILARLGGDEFVIVLEGGELSRATSMVAGKIIESVGRICQIEHHELHTTPSIGISIYPDDGSDIESLMKNADTAMYNAKSAGRNNFQYYAAFMNEMATLRLHLERSLRSAVGGGEFRLEYQPQVTLASDRATGVEALIRWHTADRGIVSPAAFIPLAEETGLILRIGEWVLRTACRDARRWLDAGLQFGRVSVNISPRQFRQADFTERVAAILVETGLPGSALELEITEGAIMETADVAVARLRDLKALGLTLAIDDFGTGYSSLAYLKRFPVDRLKIDRSFILDIENDPSAAQIVRAVIDLSHSLGIEVVAEGVETAGQAAFLRRQSCDSAQGFYYGHPMAASLFADFCSRQAAAETAASVAVASRISRRKSGPAPAAVSLP
ncbi:MAG: EAL domain-containing protein [Bacteroidota bacterium]